MTAEPGGSRDLRRIGLTLAAGLAVVAFVLLLLDRAGTPLLPKRLQDMDCRELGLVMLQGDDAQKHAAAEPFDRKNCF